MHMRGMWRALRWAHGTPQDLPHIVHRGDGNGSPRTPPRPRVSGQTFCRDVWRPSEEGRGAQIAESGGASAASTSSLGSFRRGVLGGPWAPPAVPASGEKRVQAQIGEMAASPTWRDY
jgi:hypothetical protein